MRSDFPLISAIMPTRGRPQYVREAVELFEAQTWPNKELVIVDDFYQPSFAVPPTAEGIVYLIEKRALTLGAKRNLACSETAGEIICHWDDDDHSAPGRMMDQAIRLMTSGADVTGYTSMEFRDGERRWMYTGDGKYMLGTSLMYRREYWQRHPFDAHLNVAEDLIFQTGSQFIAVPADGLMWARNHAGNTSPRKVTDTLFREIVTCA